MNERYRAELRQGLTQYLMMIYESYRSEVGEKKAKELVLQCIEEQYAYFHSGSLSQNKIEDFIQQRIKRLSDLMNAADDDLHLRYYERIQRLESALEELKEEL